MTKKRIILIIPYFAAFILPALVLSCFTVRPESGTAIAEQVKYDIKTSRDAVGVAVIVHGLNLKPEKMADLTELFQSMNYHTINVTLKGHNGNIDDFVSVCCQDWLDDFEGAFAIAREMAEEEHLPVVFVGFSLGALTGLEYRELSGAAPFSKTVLFAPAIELKFPEWLAKCFFGLKDNITLKSAQKGEYKVYPGSSIAAYKALFGLLDRFHNDHHAFDANSALIVMDNKDEAVSLKRIVRNYNMDNKQIITLQRKKNDMEIKAHHLVIDRHVLGNELWETVAAEIAGYLAN